MRCKAGQRHAPASRRSAPSSRSSARRAGSGGRGNGPRTPGSPRGPCTSARIVRASGSSALIRSTIWKYSRRIAGGVRRSWPRPARRCSRRGRFRTKYRSDETFPSLTSCVHCSSGILMPNALSIAKATSRKSRLSMPRSLMAWLSGVILSRGMSQVSEMIPATVSKVDETCLGSLANKDRPIPASEMVRTSPVRLPASRAGLTPQAPPCRKSRHEAATASLVAPAPAVPAKSPGAASVTPTLSLSARLESEHLRGPRFGAL